MRLQCSCTFACKGVTLFHFKVLLFAASFQFKHCSIRFPLFGLMWYELQSVVQRTPVPPVQKPQGVQPPPPPPPPVHLTPRPTLPPNREPEPVWPLKRKPKPFVITQSKKKVFTKFPDAPWNVDEKWVPKESEKNDVPKLFNRYRAFRRARDIR